MSNIPSITFLNQTRNEGALKSGFFGPILACMAETPGGAAITELTISSGVVRPTGAAHTIDTESDAASDILDTMEVVNHPEGRIVVIRCADASRAVTINHAAGGTGQLLLRDGEDITLSDTTDFVWFQRVGDYWYEFGRTGPQTATVIDGMDAEEAADALGVYTPDDLASQGEAEAGTDNASLMTPLRVAQAVAALAPSGGAGILGVTEVASTQSVTVPSGASNALCLLFGSGAGGARSYASGGTYRGGGGGGAGAGVFGLAVNLNEGESITVTVGEAGTSNTSGEATSFGSFLTAKGGTCNLNSANAGANGDVVEGTNGYALIIFQHADATNGESQDQYANGGNGASLLTRGVGGTFNALSVGGNASGYGAGGAGGSLDDYTMRAGGNGSPGHALIIWMG